MFEWLGFTYRNLPMLELGVCSSRENVSFDSDRPYGTLSTPNYMNFPARDVLGHTGSINSNLKLHAGRSMITNSHGSIVSPSLDHAKSETGKVPCLLPLH